MYNILVTFDKHFLTGLLTGLESTAKVRFPGLAESKTYVEWLTGKETHEDYWTKDIWTYGNIRVTVEQYPN